ncbi:hypothetical protein A4X13_0g6771 [Tilletia indica]|uniref:Uncharacterized protein n=1 Tax=Tilletia indica TaxID=43049 RepID=A0A177T6S1_9BASI|nr:hypothetical protein A4X13_0g6771 [Tilletia indica]
MSSSPQLPSALNAREATVHAEDMNVTDAGTSHAATNFLDLPHGLVFQIFDRLDYRSLHTMRSTCKLLYQVLRFSRFDRALFRSGDERCEESGNRAVEDAIAEYAQRGCPPAAWLALDRPHILISPDEFHIDVHPVLRSLGWRMDQRHEVLATWPWRIQEEQRPIWLEETATWPPISWLKVSLRWTDNVIVIRGSGRGGAVTVEQVLLCLLLSWTHYTRKAAKMLPRSEVPAHGCAWFSLPHYDGSPNTLWLSFLDVNVSKSVIEDLAAGQQCIYSSSCAE